MLLEPAKAIKILRKTSQKCYHDGEYSFQRKEKETRLRCCCEYPSNQLNKLSSC
ncbi:hypothetical protein Hanom_Chr14g01260311 [Helianthus anomalus]